MRRLRILTWHVHGSYLYYLTQVPHDFYVLSKPARSAGYAGRFGHFPWGDNVHDMPVSEVARHEFDCILFQDDAHYLEDQHHILTPAQRALPRIYLEHDPPRDSPTDTPHLVDDPDTLLVHVTPFNRLMWDNGRTPTRVIEHGVLAPRDVEYSGTLARGLVVVNHLARRGRRLGADVFAQVREQVPLDLVGMGADEAGGLGEVRHDQLPAFAARYRFFFNPIRYTSMGLAVIEAMLLGMPIVGLATTEMACAIENGVSGYVDTDPARLVGHMHALLADPEHARALGANARRQAETRFGIERFVADWCDAFGTVTGTARTPPGQIALSTV
ncbi:glycosyltransferase [Chitiniphilus purpureus]|uniref:Glycosyltransferase n=1 Tax=Chitiniphilus purpureus TaxID=2981137 RepID=A0ABY6DPI6_9NEIS|nr:glycosyltransferase [Chitiniphilus sp. CD1]UXY16299.1 glycosyltransferase [Chitiniphilus sp. CD1]